MALAMQSPMQTTGMGTPPTGTMRSLRNSDSSREKKTFKDKLLTMVQEAEVQEQQAMREAQAQDKKSLSISMLLAGRPQAFVDFFNLTHGRFGDASTSGRTEEVDLQELPQESLLLLKAQLVKADAALSAGVTEDVYNAYKVLAKYFTQLGRLHIAEFFFKKSLSLAKNTSWIPGELEANLALGVVYEELQDVQAAIMCHERRLQVASEHMMTEDMAVAYQSLTSVYLGQAEKEEKARELSAALSSYSKCLSAAERAGDARSMAKSHYRMGIIHFQNKKWQDAMFHLRKFVEEGASALGDKGAEGIALTTLAQCLLEVKDTEGSVELLEKYLETTQRGQDQHGPAMACCSLGTIYLEQGNHLKAVTYFEKFFEIARTVNDRQLLDAARFNLGVAKGALRMPQFMQIVNSDLSKLMQWKNSRADFC